MNLSRKKMVPSIDPGEERRLTIRIARPEDARKVADLAELDEAPVPADPLLLAEVDGELWVAVSLTTSSYVADPFRPSGELAFELLERSRADRGRQRRRRRRWVARPRTRLRPSHDGP